jgi:uncharacterized protein (TIGR02145 family)
MKLIFFVIIVTISNYAITLAQAGVKIGAQIWMTENLDVSKFRNGDEIQEAKNFEEWRNAVLEKIPVFCYYNFNPENGSKYGKLYNWAAIKDSREITPEGWSIPTRRDWDCLITYVKNHNRDYLNMFYNSLSEKELNEWNGENDFYVLNLKKYGFFKNDASELLGGCLWIHDNENEFKDIGKKGFWWDCDNIILNENRLNNDSKDDIKTTQLFSDFFFELPLYSKFLGLSVRCVKYDLEESTLQMGNQFWMTKNLDIVTFRNGDTIQQALNEDEIYYASQNEKPIWCYYNFDSTNNKLHGKLYNYYAVIDKRGIGPRGYHVPSIEEWKTLIDPNTHLEFKSRKELELSPGPFFPRMIYSDLVFAATSIPSGYWGIGFYGLGNESKYWTSSVVKDNTEAYFIDYSKIFSSSAPNGFMFPIRCIKDSTNNK